jgi:hypothetical protein
MPGTSLDMTARIFSPAHSRGSGNPADGSAARSFAEACRRPAPRLTPGNGWTPAFAGVSGDLERRAGSEHQLLRHSGEGRNPDLCTKNQSSLRHGRLDLPSTASRSGGRNGMDARNKSGMTRGACPAALPHPLPPRKRGSSRRLSGSAARRTIAGAACASRPAMVGLPLSRERAECGMEGG